MQMALKEAISRKNFDITELNKIMSSSLSSQREDLKIWSFNLKLYSRAFVYELSNICITQLILIKLD